jgi:glycosyltransferase involved in cell wall biosynthesis/2-polyprenyl-3-methyl-5-hydroxy-6-metoxy-1,4-benzoquinol methylase
MLGRDGSVPPVTIDPEGSPAKGTRPPKGIFVFGSPEVALESLEESCRSFLPVEAGVGNLAAIERLRDLNEELLHHLGGSLTDPPRVSVSEIIRILAPWADRARDAFAAVFARSADLSAPWIWADPRHCILIPFWIDLLEGDTIGIFVFNDPRDLGPAAGNGSGDASHDIDRWDFYNRSALAVTNMVPTIVASMPRLRKDPDAVYENIRRFMAHFGLDPTCVDKVPVHHQPPREHTRTQLPDRARILHELLTRYEALSTTELSSSSSTNNEIVLGFSSIYDERYYESHCGGLPYDRSEPHWMQFFDGIAAKIALGLGPRTVLDVGCAIGMLVEALRSHDVDATGVDISEWAISQIPEPTQGYCRVGSITEDFGGHYDLITCIEVVEHLPRSMAGTAIANLCRHADQILFSSSPDDFDEPTHLNVETTAYWAELFGTNGFVRDFDFDASFLAPQAILFRRAPLDKHGAVAGYERALWSVRTENRREREDFVAARAQLADEVAQSSVQIQRLREQIDELDARRRAERGAPLQALELADNRHIEMARRLEVATTLLAEATAQLEAVYRTRLFRYSSKLRSAYAGVQGHAKPWTLDGLAPPPEPEFPSYSTWVAAYDTVDDDDRTRLADRIAGLADPPKFSVLMPTYNTPRQYLLDAVNSVRAQIYSNWEICIADDASTEPETLEALAEIEQMDERITVARRSENGHISAALNTALSMSTGTWVACLDHDDTLPEHSLATFALTIAADPELAFIYSDEDKIDVDGIRRDPFFKPDFDPLLLLGQNYVCHLTVFRRELAQTIGGYREGYEGSQDWDLALRATALLSPGQIAHIPRVLYHWRIHPASTASALTAKSYAAQAGERAVADHLERTGRSGQVLPLGLTGWTQVKWAIPVPAPLVSIIIPTRDGTYLQRCVDSIRQRTTYSNFEIVVVDNGSEHLGVLEYLRGIESSLTIIRDDGPFNYPQINNRAVERSHGEIVCLLNDDTEVLGGDWLDEMVGQVLQEGVGAVGAMLYYPSGEIQHAGVVLGIGGVAGHAFKKSDRLSVAGPGRIQLPRSLSAVTAACMVVRRETWEQVKGMDAENLPVAFNDIDLCLRIREAGWRIAWTPFAELLHHESISRGLDTEGERAARFGREIRYMKQRWGFELRNDPAYNPNLTLQYETFALAWPSRVPPLGTTNDS